MDARPGFTPARVYADGHVIYPPSLFDGLPLTTHDSREIIRLTGPRPLFPQVPQMPVVWSCLGLEYRMDYYKYRSFRYLAVPLVWPTSLLLIFWAYVTLNVLRRTRANWTRRQTRTPRFPLAR